MDNYIYLIQEREFIKSGEKIYKIGKTKQKNLKRLQNYPKGSKLIFQCICDDCDTVEIKLINIFKKKYIQQKDIGTEYFKGNYDDMIVDIYNCIMNIYDNTDSDAIQINSFDKYVKYSNNISNIIITDTSTLEGYVKFKNCLWQKINSKDYISDNLVCFLNNNITYPINKKRLIGDICKKCYNSNPKFYKLSQTEYIIKVSKHDYILDVKTFTIKNCGVDIDDAILTDTNKYLTKVFANTHSCIQNINTEIVDNILKSLISDENIISKYKKLCYNCIVNQENTIIFEDYSNTNHLLTHWLKSLINRLSNNTAIYFDDNEQNNYIYSFNSVKPKLVIILGKYIDKKTVNNKINLLTKLGIKNIIVLYSDKCMYNYDTYSKFIIDNKDYILSLFRSSNNTLYDYFPSNPDDIFYFSYMLSNNYLKWCCNM